MNSLPLLLSLAEELDNLGSHCNDDFGLGLYPCDFHPIRRPPALRLSLPLQRLSLAERQQQQVAKRAAQKACPVGKDGFQVCMDVQQFKPNEITVKTVDDSVVVEGKHEEREDDHGYISRHFVRRYTLPKGYHPDHVISTLSSDGVLTVKVPPPPKSGDSNERLIQIQHTGPAHLSVKDNAAEDKKEAGDQE